MFYSYNKSHRKLIKSMNRIIEVTKNRLIVEIKACTSLRKKKQNVLN